MQVRACVSELRELVQPTVWETLLLPTLLDGGFLARPHALAHRHAAFGVRSSRRPRAPPPETPERRAVLRTLLLSHLLL